MALSPSELRVRTLRASARYPRGRGHRAGRRLATRERVRRAQTSTKHIHSRDRNDLELGFSDRTGKGLALRDCTCSCFQHINDAQKDLVPKSPKPRDPAVEAVLKRYLQPEQLHVPGNTAGQLFPIPTEQTVDDPLPSPQDLSGSKHEMSNIVRNSTISFYWRV